MGRALERTAVGFSPGREKNRESSEQMGVEHLFIGKEVTFVAGAWRRKLCPCGLIFLEHLPSGKIREILGY